MEGTVVELTDTTGDTGVVVCFIEGDKTFNHVVVRKSGILSCNLPGTKVCANPEGVADYGSFPQHLIVNLGQT